jgi:hypothetical protein
LHEQKRGRVSAHTSGAGPTSPRRLSSSAMQRLASSTVRADTRPPTPIDVHITGPPVDTRTRSPTRTHTPLHSQPSTEEVESERTDDRHQGASTAHSAIEHDQHSAGGHAGSIQNLTAILAAATPASQAHQDARGTALRLEKAPRKCVPGGQTAATTSSTSTAGPRKRSTTSSTSSTTILPTAVHPEADSTTAVLGEHRKRKLAQLEPIQQAVHMPTAHMTSIPTRAKRSTATTYKQKQNQWRQEAQEKGVHPQNIPHFYAAHRTTVTQALEGPRAHETRTAIVDEIQNMSAAT